MATNAENVSIWWRHHLPLRCELRHAAIGTPFYSHFETWRKWLTFYRRHFQFWFLKTCLYYNQNLTEVELKTCSQVVRVMGWHRLISCNVGYSNKQGKSEGFESCDRPIVRKHRIWVKIGDVLYRVTLKFDGWPWKTIGLLSFAVSSFVQHFIAIGEFKLELQSGNAQFGSNSTIFRAVWPCNLTYDLEKQKGTSTMLLQALCIIS